MAAKEPGLFALLGALPEQISNLVSKQLDMVKAEYKDKAALSLIGLIFGGIAFVLLLLLLVALITWLFIALASAMELWVAGLIIVGSLLLLMLIFAGAALLAFKNVGSWKPEKSIASFQEDIQIITTAFAPKKKSKSSGEEQGK